MGDDATAQKVPSTYDRLAARFAASDHKTKTISGTGLTYVDGETVVTRLNEVLGFDGWSFEVGQINVLEDEVWATGKLTVYSGDRVIVREQVGGQIINRKRGIPARPYVPADGDRPEQPAVPAQKGDIVELSNDIKGAITDCLKKCATLVGVGLYLYDPVERREVESEMKQSSRPKAPPDTNAANPTTTGNRAATTPAASGAAPSSSSTTATSAAPAPSTARLACGECETPIDLDGSVTIMKKKDGPKVTVTVKEFRPVCEQRLGSLHCASCYDRKWLGAA